MNERICDGLAIFWAVCRLLYWKLWGCKPRRLNHNYGPKGNENFISAAQAAELIPDRATVIVCALGATGWCPAIFRAVAQRFSALGTPREFKITAPAGQGARGKIPWSIDDWGKYPGLIFRFITGHVESFRHIRQAACQSWLDLVCLPQGDLSRLFSAMAEGKKEFVSADAVGTFVDERFGPGVKGNLSQNKCWVTVTAKGQLSYTCSKPDIAIINATKADEDGNISVENSALLGETLAAAKATKLNGGKVMVQVGRAVKKLPNEEIYLPWYLVDRVVVRPETPQAFCFTQNHPWRALVAGANVNLRRALLVNTVLSRIAGLSPRRDKTDARIARMAAWMLANKLAPGARGNIGVGLPEEVAKCLVQGGVMADLNIQVESGPQGGIAASGPFFGCMINPKQHRESGRVFDDFAAQGLDFTVLGALEIDWEGNANLSRSGPEITDVIGPGGAINIIAAAKIVVFVMRRNHKSGACRFVDKVQEVTFNAKQALAAGKTVYYVTDKCVLELTAEGLALSYYLADVAVDPEQTIKLFPPGFPILCGTRFEGCEARNTASFPKSVEAGENFKLVLLGSADSNM